MNAEVRQNSNERYLSSLPRIPMSFSDLTLSGCKSIISASLTYTTASLNQSLSSTCESTNVASCSKDSMTYQSNKQWTGHSQLYGNYPSCFPVIKQPTFGFSANWNQNSSNYPVSTAYESCISGLSPFTSSLTSFVNTTLLHDQGNQYSEHCYPNNPFYGSQSSCNQFKILGNDKTPAQSLASPSTDTQLNISVPLSPPPIRRLVFPFRTLSHPVEDLQQAPTIFTERKTRKTDSSSHSEPNVIPECNVSKRSDFKSTTDVQETDLTDFTLHGMDYRHETSRNRHPMVRDSFDLA